ncbi:hypothetical protein TRFO_40265 [Tritrichomonas foetus]|uniref:Mif2/CENP-C cupin domain-containing protein n=1 Tax=Tritrichomonas foetus TaxID=1144522 RepID=A0A1J4J8A3_9EUKA|nr:hypothetical protein TRFO_40265 [Tritrichomonas foetus]|eukprot:OHS93460.1 hypothetical protein TRFO_40265 [Tritrichomonas foetus]
MFPFPDFSRPNILSKFNKIRPFTNPEMRNKSSVKHENTRGDIQQTCQKGHIKQEKLRNEQNFCSKYIKPEIFLKSQQIFEELDEMKIIPYFNQHSQINKPSFSRKPRLEMHIGEVRVYTPSDKKLKDKIRKHMDQEYLERFKHDYTFIQTPPRAEIPNGQKSGEFSPYFPRYNISYHKTEKKDLPILSNKEMSSEETCSESSEPKIDDFSNNKTIHKFDADECELPIALRRSRRPKTKPLRYWMGEKILYQPDESGCMTKVREIKFDDKETIKKDETMIQIETNEKRIFQPKSAGQKYLIKEGGVQITLNGKTWKSSEGGYFYVAKGKEFTVENLSGKIATIFVYK